jgi:hypothetical protein
MAPSSSILPNVALPACRKFPRFLTIVRHHGLQFTITRITTLTRCHNIYFTMQTELCRHSDTKAVGDTVCCNSCGDVLSYALESGQQVYTHRPLRLDRGEIRLVVVLPGTGLDPITCRIITVELESSPEYVAISYTWATEDGDISKSQTVHVEGEDMFENSKAIRVTRNCEAALQQVRHADREQTLWIDSICINQTNVEERNHQVRLMDKIYRTASSVEICITDPSQCYRKALWLLARERWVYIQTCKGSQYDDHIAQLAALFERRYFQRVWVLQEVLLARTTRLHVNEEVIPLDKWTFEHLHRFCLSSPTIIPKLPLWSAIWTWKTDLVTCLHTTMEAASTDPRDRVFAITSLLKPRVRDMITIDYSSTLQDVLIDAVTACIADSGSLEILSFANLPRSVNISSASAFGMAEFKLFLARQSPGQMLSKNSLRPNLYGSNVYHGTSWFPRVNINTLSKAGDFLAVPMRSSPYSINESITTVILERSTGAVPDMQILPRLKVRSHIIDTCIKSTDEAVDNFFRAMSEGFDTHIGLNPYWAQRLMEDVRDGVELDSFRRYIDIVRNQWPPRTNKVFRTQHGFAYSESDSIFGDSVFVIAGAQHPFLLRGVGPDEYRIVGKCVYWTAMELDNWNLDGFKLDDNSTHRVIEIY